MTPGQRNRIYHRLITKFVYEVYEYSLSAPITRKDKKQAELLYKTDSCFCNHVTRLTQTIMGIIDGVLAEPKQ